jgi:hypothetical protein
MQRDGWQLREAWGICSGGTGTLACVRLFGWCLWAQPSQVGRAAELGRHRPFLRTLRVSRVPSFVLYRLRLGSPALHSGTGMDVRQHCMPSLGQHDRRDKFGYANSEYVVDVSQEQMEPTPEETLSGAMATQKRCTFPCIVGCTPSLELKEISRCPVGPRRGQPERNISIQTGYRCA